MNKIEVVHRQIHRVFSNILWVFLGYRTFKNCALQIWNIEKVKLFGWTRWHLSCKYFTGKMNGTAIFLKTDSELQLLSNEEMMYKLLNAYHAPIPKYYGTIRCAGTRALMIEAISGFGLSDYLDNKYPLTSDVAKEIAQQIVNIVGNLHAARIIHRDFTPANLLISISEDNAPHVYLIDLTFAVNVTNDAEIDANLPEWVLSRLGREYREEYGVWDDAYSASLIIQALQNIARVDLSRILDQIEAYRGKLVYRKTHTNHDVVTIGS